MRGAFKLGRNSIVYRLVIQFAVILTILFSALLLSNVYSLQVVQQHMLTSSENTLAIYVESIHNRLDIYANDLLEVFENHVDEAMNYARLTGEGDYFKELQLMNALKAKMSNNYASDGMFIQFPDKGLILSQFGKRIQSAEKRTLLEFMKHQDWKPKRTRAGKRGEWSAMNVGGTFYLFKFIRYEDVCFGTYVKADSLLSITNRESNFSSLFLLSGQEGKVISSSYPLVTEGFKDNNELMDQLEGRYIFVWKPIEELGQITHMVAKKSVFSGLKLIQWSIMGLGILSIAIVPLVVRFLAKDMLQPILELVRAAKAVEKGKGKFPLPAVPYSLEFMKLFHSFHSMVHEITRLKIQSYEEKIEKTRVELKVMQMQIRPHFYLNAISTISSLTYHHRNEEIRQMIQRLSLHLRYMFKAELSLVPITEEIRHVENYIRMQEIRYPGQIFYMTDIQSMTGTVRIPQLLIHTFVENIFKHALTYGEMLSIFIQTSAGDIDMQPVVIIVIEDNGEGFSSAFLKQSGCYGSAAYEEGEQIGIANICRTLQLLYKRDDLITFSNTESSGARVEIRVPIRNEADDITK
ncbi:sensor histidine kinase [Paenibacillus vandeheii]